jgi:peptide/nickel transport system permease protein
MLGLFLVSLIVLLALIGPWIVPYPEHVAGGINTGSRFKPPSWAFPFGTNELGQDVFSLVIAGTRVSLLAGLAVVVVAALIGTAIGAIAGCAGGSEMGIDGGHGQRTRFVPVRA